MYTYKIGISAQEHDDFVKASSQTNLLQSASWAKVKDNWDNERIGFYKNNQLVASASILIKPLPLSMTMLYIPRGPIMDYGDKELLTFVLASLKKFAKEKKALFIKFDPSLFLAESKMGGELQDKAETIELIQQLQEAGAVWVGRTESLDETIQPRLQANIHKEDFNEELLSKSTRQAIRTARNKGIQIQFGGAELLDDFSALMKKTENRKNIHLRGKDYYQKLLDTYPEHSYVTLSSIDLRHSRKQRNLPRKPSLARLRITSKNRNASRKRLTSYRTKSAKGLLSFPCLAHWSWNTAKPLKISMPEWTRSTAVTSQPLSLGTKRPNMLLSAERIGKIWAESKTISRAVSTALNPSSIRLLRNSLVSSTCQPILFTTSPIWPTLSERNCAASINRKEAYDL